MAKKRDYYDILGVKRTATADEIRSAYRKLARKLHPDVNKADNAAEQFNEVQEAYDVLSDDEKRKAYDRFGHAAPGPGVGAGPGPGTGPGGVRWSYSTGGGGGGPGQTGGFEDISSIFEEMFGGSPGTSQAGGSPFGGARASRARAARPQRGRDISHSVAVAFNTAALGGTQQIRIQRDGQIETIDVKIPAGIQSGAKLRVRGKGEPGTGGGAGQAGDLMLTIDIAPHPYFRRDGLDVLIDVPINIAEAALGVTVTVPLLTGSAELRIPPGASSGQKLRIKGKGIADSRGSQGDYYAVVQIVAPRDLSKKGQELVGDLARELKNPRESAPWADDLKE